MNTVELVIVIALFAVFMSGVLAVTFLSNDAILKNQLAFEKISEARQELSLLEDFKFTAFNASSTNATVFPRTPCLQDVTFNYSIGIYEVLRLNQMFFDTTRFDALGEDCHGFPNPPNEIHEISGVTIDSAEFISDIDIYGDALVVSAYSDSISSPDLFLLSLESQSVLSDVHSGEGINAVDMAGSFVFAAARQSTNQFQIFEIDGEDLLLTASTSLPTVTGNWPEGLSIFYENERVYVGTHRTAGREFHIYDVSDPYQPIWLGSREMNHNINDIVVRDDVAYLATSGNIRDVIILDVSNPSNITQIAALDIVGNEDGRRIYLSGEYLFLGRFKANTNSGKDVYVLKLDDEDHKVFEVAYSEKTGGNIQQIIPIGSSLIVATDKNGGEIRVMSWLGQTATHFTSLEKVVAFDVENSSLVAVTSDGEVKLFEMQ